MRSGFWRGIAVAIVLGSAVLTGPMAPEARAFGIFHKAIPRETLAMDYRTGDVMMAPPIPYGEYAKDYAGAVHGAAGMTFGAIHGLAGKVKGLCGKCGGGLCGKCGGNGLLHGKSCNDCGGDGCGRCGSGLLGHGGVEAFAPGESGTYQHAGLLHHGDGSGLGHHHGAGVACVGPGCASAQSVPAVPAKTIATPQAMASTQINPVCGGCLGVGRLGNGGGCGLCGGSGRLKGLFGHGGNLCGGCGGKGCGSCGGKGLLAGLCGLCKGAGCGACKGGNGQGLCRNCGGAGCGLCNKLKGVGHGLISKITHKGQIKYFVGAGGPVPITPGYVPYVISTRSPRDYFAFPPFSDQVP